MRNYDTSDRQRTCIPSRPSAKHRPRQPSHADLCQGLLMLLRTPWDQPRHMRMPVPWLPCMRSQCTLQHRQQATLPSTNTEADRQASSTSLSTHHMDTTFHLILKATFSTDPRRLSAILTHRQAIQCMPTIPCMRRTRHTQRKRAITWSALLQHARHPLLSWRSTSLHCRLLQLLQVQSQDRNCLLSMVLLHL